MALAPVSATATTTMSVTYYTIAENDQDMNHLASGPFSNEVKSDFGTARVARSEYSDVWLHVGLFHRHAFPGRCDRERRDHLVEPKSEQRRERRSLRCGPDRHRDNYTALRQPEFFPAEWDGAE